MKTLLEIIDTTGEPNNLNMYKQTINVRKQVGRQLKGKRKGLKLSMYEVSKRAEITADTVKAIESGTVSGQLDNITRICIILRIEQLIITI